MKSLDKFTELKNNHIEDGWYKVTEQYNGKLTQFILNLWNNFDQRANPSMQTGFDNPDFMTNGGGGLPLDRFKNNGGLSADSIKFFYEKGIPVKLIADYSCDSNGHERFTIKNQLFKEFIKFTDES